MVSTCNSNEKKIILCEGFTCVKECEYYGVKNTNGQWVVKPIYDEIMYLDRDFICAKKDGWYGFAHLNNPPSEIDLIYEIELEPDAWIDIFDDDVNLIEDCILKTFDDSRKDYTQYGCLLELRKEMINRRILGQFERILPDIIAFNDALTNALKKMYDKAHRIWNDLNSHSNCGDEAELTARCYLSYEYPELHPIQGERRDELWGALCDGGWNPLYEDGVTLSALRLPSDIDGSFDALIGMDCPPPNWNEGLDRELTRDLHLTSAFHHLFDHTSFAITDFIYIRNFETEIKIEINSKG